MCVAYKKRFLCDFAHKIMNCSHLVIRLFGNDPPNRQVVLSLSKKSDLDQSFGKLTLKRVSVKR